MEKGRLIQSISGRFAVQTAAGVLFCTAKGSFRRDNRSPVGGDFVEVDPQKALITDILPRQNELVRPPCANVDMVYLVVSAASPKPSSLIIDSLLAIFAHQNIPAALVISKPDLDVFDRLQETYTLAGYPVFVFHGLTGAGKENLQERMAGKFNLFVGNSGVGKSTLLNALAPDLELKTGEISQKLGRGRHTTRQVTLYPLPTGGYLADTPGFSTVDLLQYGLNDAALLPHCFPEMEACLGHCRFSDCSHTKEAGCAVLDKLGNGEIARSRHESYCTLYDQLRKVKSWEIGKK